MLSIRNTKQGLVFKVRLQPRSSRNRIVGLQGEALKVQLTAPPVKGEANKALLEFLAGKLGVGKSQLQILSGHTSREKQIGVRGVGEEDILRLLDL
jgi:hypothetical protein